jgi:hypothetical protein
MFLIWGYINIQWTFLHFKNQVIIARTFFKFQEHEHEWKIRLKGWFSSYYLTYNWLFRAPYFLASKKLIGLVYVALIVDNLVSWTPKKVDFYCTLWQDPINWTLFFLPCVSLRCFHFRPSMTPPIKTTLKSHLFMKEDCLFVTLRFPKPWCVLWCS